MPSKVKVKKKSKPAYDPRLLDFSNGDPLMGEETGPMYSTLPPEQLPSRAEYDAAMQAHFAQRHAAQDAFMQKLWSLQDQAGVQRNNQGQPIGMMPRPRPAPVAVAAAPGAPGATPALQDDAEVRAALAGPSLDTQAARTHQPRISVAGIPDRRAIEAERWERAIAAASGQPSYAEWKENRLNAIEANPEGPEGFADRASKYRNAPTKGVDLAANREAYKQRQADAAADKKERRVKVVQRAESKADHRALRQGQIPPRMMDEMAKNPALATILAGPAAGIATGDAMGRTAEAQALADTARAKAGTESEILAEMQASAAVEGELQKILNGELEVSQEEYLALVEMLPERLRQRYRVAIDRVPSWLDGKHRPSLPEKVIPATPYPDVDSAGSVVPFMGM